MPVLRQVFPKTTNPRPGWLGRSIVLVSLLLLLLGWASLVAAAPVGTFIQVEGTVEVLRQGKPPAVPAKIRDGVDQGDQVRTKSKSRAQLRFVDDTVLTLAPGSSILIEDYLYDGSKGTRQANLNLFRGLAYTVVNKILQTEKPDFVFKTHTRCWVSGAPGSSPWWAPDIPAAISSRVRWQWPLGPAPLPRCS